MKKVVSVALSAVCALGCMAAAGCGEDGGKEGTLNIYVLKKGYGTEWAYALKDKFLAQEWVKEKYPNLQVVITEDPNDSTYNNELSKGKASKFDLMFSGYAQGSNGDARLLDLTEVVYNSEVPGEGVKFADKLVEGIADANSYNSAQGKRYGTVSYVNGMFGILYNKTKLDALGFTEPNTTDELIGIMQSVKERKNGNGEAIPDGVYDNSYSIVNTTNGYSYQMFSMWWAQYEGIEEYEKFYEGLVGSEEDDSLEYSPNIFKQQGRLESLTVLENLFKREVKYDDGSVEYGYLHPNAAKVDYLTHQLALLKGQGLFHFNGDYYTTEMEMHKKADSDKIGMLKTPVISSIIKHEDCVGQISDDAELSALIKAIDAGETALKGEGYEVNQTAFDKVKEARSLINSSTYESGMIPTWSVNQEAAIDFLRFMATDIAYETVVEATDGLSLPFKYDLKSKNIELYGKLEPVHQTKIDLYSSNPIIVKEKAAFHLGRCGLFPLISQTEGTKVAFEAVFGSAENAMTAQQVFDADYDYWTRNSYSKWNDLMNLAGL